MLLFRIMGEIVWLLCEPIVIPILLFATVLSSIIGVVGTFRLPPFLTTIPPWLITPLHPVLPVTKFP